MDVDTQPYDIPAWTTPPTDDEIVLAIVGRRGTSEQRRQLELVARDLLLPRLRVEAGSELLMVRRWLTRAKQRYELEHKDQIEGAFLRSAIDGELAEMDARAFALAVARVHADLFPSEPMPERWGDVPARPVAEIERQASQLEQRLGELERRSP